MDGWRQSRYGKTVALCTIAFTLPTHGIRAWYPHPYASLPSFLTMAHLPASIIAAASLTPLCVRGRGDHRNRRLCPRWRVKVPVDRRLGKSTRESPFALAASRRRDVPPVLATGSAPAPTSHDVAILVCIIAHHGDLWHELHDLKERKQGRFNLRDTGFPSCSVSTCLILVGERNAGARPLKSTLPVACTVGSSKAVDL